MDLFLMRHGIAEDFDPMLHAEDAERALTPKGWRRMRRISRGLRQTGFAPTLFLTSPLRRARETTSALREVFPEVPSEVSVALTGSDVEALWEEVTARRHPGLCLIGHQPLLGELAAWLLGTSGVVEMKRATLVHLDVSIPRQRAATLRALLPPGFTRRLETD